MPPFSVILCLSFKVICWGIKMLDIEDLMLDDELVSKGVWVDYRQGTKLKLSCQENQAYLSYIAAQVRKNKLMIEDVSTESTDLIQKIMRQAAARFLILDWDGFTAKGEPVQYSVTVGEKVLQHDPNFREFVMEKSKDYSLFRASVLVA